MSARKELSNKTFERLYVLRRVGSNNKGNSQWECRCDCGKIIIVLTHSLTSGHTKSCGCYSHEKFVKRVTTHGQTKTKLYKIWRGMKVRCYNEKHEHYKYYGGKGAEICNEWLNDFVNFMEWSENNGYSNELEIDRIDSNGNYEPNNCKWSTRIEQIRNRKNTIFMEFNGVNKPFKEWCEIYKINYKMAHQRKQKGKTFNEIFNSDVYLKKEVR